MSSKLAEPSYLEFSQSGSKIDDLKMAGALGGFGCSRNALIALNVLYICVSFILIGVAGYGIAASSITNFGVIIAIIMVSIFLLLIAICGIVASIKHHQVMLFFYMVVLFLLFVVQFSVACACLAVGDPQILSLMRQGWEHSKNDTRQSVQEYWDCCGFDTYKYGSENQSLADIQFHAHPVCSKLHCCAEMKHDDSCCDPRSESCSCTPCFRTLEEIVKASLRLCGGIGLFFSFTEIVGIFIALRFRNQKDPNIDPADFL